MFEIKCLVSVCLANCILGHVKKMCVSVSCMFVRLQMGHGGIVFVCLCRPMEVGVNENKILYVMFF